MKWQGAVALVLRYEAGADQESSRAIGINPELSIRRIKLISNQLDLLVVYIASCFPLNNQLIPLNYNTLHWRVVVECHMDLVVPRLSSQYSFKQVLWVFTYLKYEQLCFKSEVHPEARQ